MNKSGFIKKLSEKLEYDEEKCIVIESIIEDHFIIGESNKEKIIADLVEKAGVSQEEADNIYNTAADIIKTALKDKLLHPFRKDENED